MIYLIFGADAEQRESKISELKRQHAPGKDSLSFDYEVLDGHKLDPDSLRKALLALPVLSSQRFVLVRNCHQLSDHNRRIILDFSARLREHLVLVLEAERLNNGDELVAGLKPYAAIHRVETPRPATIFDVTRAMSTRRDAEALKLLYGLLSGGSHPLQLLGGLVWFWGDSRDSLSSDRFQQGLRALEEADVNIKRSRLKPDHALEILVVKLSGLMR